jgi:hypothetical protein
MQICNLISLVAMVLILAPLPALAKGDRWTPNPDRGSAQSTLSAGRR